jgi:hypothetical protein
MTSKGIEEKEGSMNSESSYIVNLKLPKAIFFGPVEIEALAFVYATRDLQCSPFLCDNFVRQSSPTMSN